MVQLVLSVIWLHVLCGELSTAVVERPFRGTELDINLGSHETGNSFRLIIAGGPGDVPARSIVRSGYNLQLVVVGLIQAWSC